MMRRIFTYVGIGIVSIIVLILLFGPMVAKGYINKNGKELIGRTLHVNKLKINVFTATVKVFNFSMYEANDKDEFVGFDTLIVNIKPLRLLHKEFYLQEFLLANPRSTVIQEDTLFNFSDLMQEDTVQQVPEQEVTEQKPAKEGDEKVIYHLNLNDIEMRNGNFTFIDKNVDNAIHVNSLSFIIPQIYWNAADSSKADIAFQLSEGGDFKSDISYDVEAGSYSGYININGLELKMILPYIQQTMNFSDMGGTFSTNLKFSGKADDMNSLSINGFLEVDNLVLNDAEGDTIAGIERNRIVLREVKPMQQIIEIDSIRMDKPFGSFVVIDTATTNWSKLMVQDMEMEEPEDSLREKEIQTDTLAVDTVPAENPLKLKVNNFEINEGAFVYKDLQFDTAFVFTISDFRVKMDSILWGENWMALQSSMKLNEKGKLEVDLGLDPNAPMDTFHMEYVISTLPLTDFDLYSRKYIGYAIKDGTLFLTGNTVISDSILKSDNKLNIRNIDMGDKEGGEYDVPVKTALFLIKDNNDDVRLDLPIEGDLSDPNTSIGGLVAKKLTEFVFKIIKTPFKFVGGIFGMGKGESSNIPFEYADIKRLDEKQKKSLDMVIKYAEKKPELNVEYLYLNDKEKEAKIMAKEWSEAEFQKSTKQNATNHEEEYLRFLQEKSTQSGDKTEEMEWAIAPQDKINRQVEQREKQRLKLVNEYLKKHDKSSLISVKAYDATNATNKDSTPRLELNIGLKSQHGGDEK